MGQERRAHATAQARTPRIADVDHGDGRGARSQRDPQRAPRRIEGHVARAGADLDARHDPPARRVGMALGATAALAAAGLASAADTRTRERRVATPAVAA